MSRDVEKALCTSMEGSENCKQYCNTLNASEVNATADSAIDNPRALMWRTLDLNLNKGDAQKKTQHSDHI